MIQALFIHDLLPGEHSAVAAFLNADTDSNSQETKTDNSTYWTFHFRHGQYNYIGFLHASSISIWLLL